MRNPKKLQQYEEERRKAPPPLPRDSELSLNMIGNISQFR